MQRKSISEIVGNEVLARPVTTFDYQEILPKGSVVKQEYLEKLLDLGIMEVYVVDEEENSSQHTEEKQDELIPEEEKVLLELREGAKQKVRKILEQHTYLHNDKDLIQLAETADSIITTVLEEKNIIEYLYEVKERNVDLYDHSVSVCTIATLVAIKMKLSEERIHEIGVGCLLHDIGSRYTTVDFFRKKEQDMSPEEVAEYHKHPVYGYSSLKDQTWISSTSRNIILYHHERLDGKGFPLKTGEIPIPCQIVGVCDLFDEMVCGIACEKKSVNEAAECLEQNKEKWFSKNVVDTLLSFIDREK